MPTPFMHLDIAEKMLQQISADAQSDLKLLLKGQWAAFYLGNVAPDVNAISELPREASHFYDLPPLPEGEAYDHMLEAHPQLKNSSRLQPAQAVFIAGYMAHLLLDLVWLRQIVVPFFLEPSKLGDRRQRTLLHFILLTYLDMQALERLPETAVRTLAAAEPRKWLPFVPDQFLCRWRDALVPQLAPGANSRTVEIYAGRLRISTAQFSRNLRDERWMQEELFAKIPIDDVLEILQNSVRLSVDLVGEYLTPERELL